MAEQENRRHRWVPPHKRAARYAKQLKSKKHLYGAKKGEKLTDSEAGLYMGYLKAQNDHASMYKYKQALAKGMSKSEAVEYSYMKLNKK